MLCLEGGSVSSGNDWILMYLAHAAHLSGSQHDGLWLVGGAPIQLYSEPRGGDHGALLDAGVRHSVAHEVHAAALPAGTEHPSSPPL